MRRFFTLIIVMFSAAMSFAQTFYSTTFSSEADFKAWILNDANGDGSTWTFDESATPSKVFYSYNSGNAGDDWLISPEITPSVTGTVMVQYVFRGSSYGESFEVYTGKGIAIADMTTREAAYENVKDQIQSGYFIIDANAGESFRVGFHATSPADRFRLYLCSVTVKAAANPVDLLVSEIVSPVTGNGLGQETVTVRVKNAGAVGVSGFRVAFALDGNTVATENVESALGVGESMEYSFKAKADMSEPRHLYAVKAWTEHDDDIDTSNDTASVAVRHKAPATVPYTMGFETTEYTDDIKFFDLNNDTGNWGIEYGSFFMNLARTGNACLGYNYDKNNNADDWAILEPISVEPGYYVLKFWYSGDDTHPEKLAVYYGNEATPEAMTNKVVEYAPFARGPYEESINILHFDKPQTVFFGFHAFSDKDENWITIDDISFDRVSSETVDIAVTEIQAPFDFVRENNGNSALFELRNLGVQDTEVGIKVSIDGNEKENATVTLKGQEFKTFLVGSVLDGLSEGKHTITVAVDAANDADTGNNSLAKDFTVLGRPSVLWNFEDAKIPADFTMRSEDGGTVNPGAGEEFNAEGWGIFNVVKHQMLGEHTLAGTSWIDGTDKADRWLILPRMSVDGTDSYLVWDASSFNGNYLENYQIQVSASEDNSMYYSKIYEVTAESIQPKTRGVSLADYAGQDIYIAFRLTTTNGECLVLDNIGVYGGVTVTGIDTPSGILKGITVSESELRAPEGSAHIILSDASGRTVRSADGCALSLSGLQPGIYMAKVTAADGNTTGYKFVRR